MITRRCGLALCALLAMGALSPAFAEPVPPAERVPVDVRRTTLLVRDIDRSLPVYRDGLGLKVVYDQFIGKQPQTDPSVPARPRMRLVLLRANDTFVGALGLLQYFDKPPVPQADKPSRPTFGGVILVMNAADLETRIEKLRSLPGVTIDTEPKPIEYPSADGKGTIPVLFSAFYDPDGYFIELNKLLGKPAGTEQRN